MREFLVVLILLTAACGATLTLWFGADSHDHGDDGDEGAEPSNR